MIGAMPIRLAPSNFARCARSCQPSQSTRSDFGTLLANLLIETMHVSNAAKVPHFGALSVAR